MGGGAGGYGKAEPTFIAFARKLVAPSYSTVEKYRSLSGKSVAVLAAAGSTASARFATPLGRRRRVANPASVQVVLARSCRRLSSPGVYEQRADFLIVRDA